MKFGTFSFLLVALSFVCSFGVNGAYTEVTENSFDTDVAFVENPVAVMFCAERDLSCRQSLSTLEETVYKHSPVTMVYVDIDKFPEIANGYQIPTVPNVPTVCGFHGGLIVNTYNGTMTDSSAQSFIEDLIKKSS